MKIAKREQGYTLIEIILATALLTMAGVFAGIGYDRTSQLGDYADLLINLSSLRDYLKTKVNCAETLKEHTLANGNISCAGSVDLKDATGNPLPSQIGNLQLSVTCTSAALAVRVRVRNANGVTAKHPLYKTESLGFSNNRINPLFSVISASQLCRSTFYSKPRAREYEIHLSSMPAPGPFVPADCDTINGSYLGPPAGPGDPVAWAAYNAPFALLDAMQLSCRNVCTASPIYAKGGNLVACTPSISRGTCVCFR